MRAISVVSIVACRSRSPSLRVCSSITISSSDALPARSPMPLIAHSTCRAPAWTPAKRVGHRQAEVVVAVDGEHDVAQLRDQPVQLGEEGGVLVGHRVADGVRDVDGRRALVDRDLARPRR